MSRTGRAGLIAGLAGMLAGCADDATAIGGTDDGTSTGEASTSSDPPTTMTTQPQPTGDDTTSTDPSTTNDTTSSGTNDTTSSGTTTGSESTSTTDSSGSTTGGVGPLDCVDADLGSAMGAAVAAGSTVGGGDDYILPCAGGGGEDIIYQWTAPADGTYTFDTAGSAFDTALALVAPDCNAAALACDDDGLGNGLSRVTADVSMGETILVVVDGYGGATGDFVLNVAQGAPSECCAPNPTPGCNDPACEAAVCGNDPFCCDVEWGPPCADAANALCGACQGPGPCCFANGTPGCEDPVIEECVCALDPDCCDVEWDAACVQAVADNACGDCTPDFGCVDADLGSAMGNAVSAGTTLGQGDDWSVGCVPPGAPDLIFSWTAPATGNYRFDLQGSTYDTALAIVAPDCMGNELACNDDSFGLLQSSLDFSVAAGATVLIVVDGYAGAAGNYVLNINEGPGIGDCCTANGSPGCADVGCQADVCAVDPNCCDITWDAACAMLADQQCAICQEGDCCAPNPTPGCEDPSCEATVCGIEPFCCAGEWFPECALLAEEHCTACLGPGPCCVANGTPGCDDAAIETCVCAVDATCCTDTWTASCAAEVDGSGCGTCNNDYTCVDQDLGSATGQAVAMGNNAGQGDDVFPSCTAPGGEDVVLRWTSPADGNWQFDTAGSDFDTALAVLFPDCAGPEVECDAQFMVNESTVTRLVPAGVEILLVVDGFGAATGDWVLNIQQAPGIGFCCAANGSPGCSDASCQNTVCAMDSTCCTDTWTLACATLASENCEVCMGLGDCCVPGESPGCNDLECMELICSMDPFCCDIAWDPLCADQANFECAVCN